VAADRFIAESKPLKEALRSANLLRSLSFNTLITGENGTGRHTLARFMKPDAPLLHGDDPALHRKLDGLPVAIVDRLEALRSPRDFQEKIDQDKIQMIGIAGTEGVAESVADLFGVRIALPPLSERHEDVPPLAARFLREFMEMFDIDGDIALNPERFDLSNNAFSLRRSVCLQLMSQQIEAPQLMGLIEDYLDRRMRVAQENIYRSELGLYEIPLIRAGTRHFKSQLKMAQAFGLNRNTLRKKINEWKDHL
jgi:DNA-binding NtrC family response regulator